MIRIAIITSLTVLMSGCATINQKPITQESLNQIQGKKLALVTHEKPSFIAFTAGKAAFALIGAAAMISEGNEIVKNNNIQDPASRIATGLSEKLKTSKSAQITGLAKQLKSEDVNSIVASNPEANYILSYKTTGWMFNYYPTDWAHYRVTYGGHLRLIDAKSKNVIAESGCSSVQGDDLNPPSKDQLLEGDAALLKNYLSKAADACIEVLARDVLSL